MRFRRLKDEQRYQTIRTELYLRIAQALSARPTVCQEILRNLGKMEHAAFYEGVDQGAVAATVAQVLDDKEALSMSSAADLHRKLYAHRDTPLTDAEAEHWPDGVDMPYTLTAPSPEYVPLTLAEALAQGAPPTPAATHQDALEPPLFDSLRSMARDFGADDIDLSLDTQDEPRQRLDDVDRDASPLVLDRIRDALLTRAETGWKPTEWAAVIMAVMEDTQIPAFVIDSQLATPQGDAVLKQAGLLDVEPSEWSLLSDDTGIAAALLGQLEGAVVSSDDADDAAEHEDPVETPTPTG